MNFTTSRLKNVPEPHWPNFKPALYALAVDEVALTPRARRVAVSPMLSKPIPGSTGEVLTCLPSPYLPHPGTGLLYLPRFLAKCRYVQTHGALPASYAKNYKRGLDRFLCLHLGIDPADMEKLVHSTAPDDMQALESGLGKLMPADVRAIKWNRELVQRGMSEEGRKFLAEALTAMGCPDRIGRIISVPDLIDFDEGRID